MLFLNKQFKSTAGYCLSSICNWWYQGELGFCCKEAEPCINVYGRVWLYIYNQIKMMNYTVVLEGLKYISEIHKNLNINLQILFFLATEREINWVFPKCFHWTLRIQWLKIMVIKRIRTCHLLCYRPRCYHSTNMTQVTDMIFNSTLVHASVIY